MLIRYASAFKRMYRKLTPDQKQRVDLALELFAQDPFDHRLHNHKLTSSKQGVRSISAGYDLRILYTEIQGHSIVLLLMVGDHKTVY